MIIVFARGKYRLVCPTTKFCMDDIYQGYLPAGGTAHYFAHNCHNGVEVKLLNLNLIYVIIINKYFLI